MRDVDAGHLRLAPVRQRMIAELLGLSEVNARRIVTRARTRLRGERRRMVDASEHRRLVETFFTAARTGDLASLEALLAADIAEDRSHEVLGGSRLQSPPSSARGSTPQRVSPLTNAQLVALLLGNFLT